jgi:hypothetical protein
MIQTIVEYLNLRIATLGRIADLHGITERRKREGDGALVPYCYVGSGEFRPVELDNGNVGWWRGRSGFTMDPVQVIGRAVKQQRASYPLRFVAVLRRELSTSDDAFMPSRLAEDIANALNFDNGDIVSMLKAINVESRASGGEYDAATIWPTEFHTSIPDLRYDLAMVAIDVTIEVVGKYSCWEGECATDPDILRLFNFCDPSVIARLTDTQVTCLESAICEAPLPCADATVTVNTTPFGTAPSGGGLNVPVVNGGSNPVGSLQGSEWVIANNATFINGVQVTDQEAEIDANIAVELDGNPSGSWNAGTQTWEVTSAPCTNPSLSVAVSNANPQVGASITITATPAGFTPTNYLFFTKQNGTMEYIGENALGVIAWTVDVFGTFDIYVQADNNTSASAFNIGGESVTSFVTITANILYINASDPDSYSGSGTAWNDLSVSNNDVTLVNGVTFDGQSMLFNGTNQYAEAPNSASLNITGAISITVWIKSTDATDGGIISKSDNANKYFGSSASKSYEIGRFGNQIYLQLSNGLGTSAMVLTIAQTAAIYNGAWNEITFTWTGTTAANGIKYYLNGVLTAQATAAITSIQSLASTLNIMGSGSYFTQGRIGAVLLNNSALSLAQITANYNSLRAIFP